MHYLANLFDNGIIINLQSKKKKKKKKRKQSNKTKHFLRPHLIMNFFFIIEQFFNMGNKTFTNKNYF